MSENPTPEQLNEVMNRYKQQKDQEREQQAESEMKIWQHTIFKMRGEFWQKIFGNFLDVWDGSRSSSTIGQEPKKLEPTVAAKLAAEIADAALDQWDERFLPKPPVPETQPEGESSTNAQLQ